MTFRIGRHTTLIVKNVIKQYHDFPVMMGKKNNQSSVPDAD